MEAVQKPKGEYTSKQKMYLCCGYFCSLMGCIGIYFWLVMFIMQSGGSPYLIYELEGIEDMNNTTEINNFKWSFLIVAIVSFLHYKSCFSWTYSAWLGAVGALLVLKHLKTKVEMMMRLTFLQLLSLKVKKVKYRLVFKWCLRALILPIFLNIVGCSKITEDIFEHKAQCVEVFKCDVIK